MTDPSVIAPVRICSLCKIPLATGDCTHVFRHNGRVTMTEAAWLRVTNELNEARGRLAQLGDE